MSTRDFIDEPCTPELETELGLRRVRNNELPAKMRQHLADIRAGGGNVSIFEEVASEKIIIVAHHGPQPTALVLRNAVAGQKP